MRNLIEWLRGVFFGWLVGASVMLMVAPQPGKETQEKLKQQGSELRDQAMNTYQNTRQRADETARNAANFVTEKSQQVKSVLNQQKILLQSSLAGVKEGVRTYQAQGAENRTRALSPYVQGTDLSTEVFETTEQNNF